MTLPFSLPYATFANYSPKGRSELSQKSQNLCYGIKAVRPNIVESIFNHLYPGSDIANLFKEFLGPDVILIPVPRSSPLVVGGLWPALELAKAFQSKGLAKGVMPCLSRITQVPKSSSALPGERPSMQIHYNSFSIQTTPSLLDFDKITLIDDVLTKGSTIYAGAMKVKEAFPNSSVKAFCIIRTMGLIPEVEKILDPAIGQIHLINGSTNREP